MKISALKIFLIVACGLLLLGWIALYRAKQRNNTSPAIIQGAKAAAIQRATELNEGKEPLVSNDTIHSHLLVDKDAYQITFHDNTQSFLITVYGSPFEWARLAAEQEFLSLTQLTKESACKVPVTVATPAFANPKEADKTFGLSFCPSPR